MLIFASVMNVPMAGIVYDPKVNGFMDYMNQNNYLMPEEFSAEAFASMACDVLKNSEALRHKLKNDSVPLRSLAQKNAYLAMELLNK